MANKCPECVKQGKRSRVNIGPSVTTSMYCPPFYDEDGIYHSHDANSRTENYSCSEGHRWSEKPVRRCPAPNCDWRNE